MALQLSEASLIEFAKTVELSATKVLEGMHSSPRGGTGVEFHSSLPLTEGEDLKYLDWKRYAATEKYFVNRFQKEERAGWTLFLDDSRSMHYGRKAEWARLWSASIIFLAKVWGDSWELFPHSHLSFDEAIEALSQMRGGMTDIHEINVQQKTQSRALLISDFFWPIEQINKVISQLEDHFATVVALQILDPREINFDFENVIDFRDMESSDSLVLDSRSVKKNYLSKLRELQDYLTNRKSENFISMMLPSENEKLDSQILRLFEKL